MSLNDAKPLGPFPGELAVHELLVVRALVESGRSLWTAIYHVRERYQTNYAASYAVRSADALCMRCTWLTTQEALAVVRSAIELAFAESGLSVMPRAADAADRLQSELDRIRNKNLDNAVFKLIARASPRSPGMEG